MCMSMPEPSKDLSHFCLMSNTDPHLYFPLREGECQFQEIFKGGENVKKTQKLTMKRHSVSGKTSAYFLND